MKRQLVVLMLLLSLTLCGCKKEAEVIQEPVDISDDATEYKSGSVDISAVPTPADSSEQSDTSDQIAVTNITPVQIEVITTPIPTRTRDEITIPEVTYSEAEYYVLEKAPSHMSACAIMTVQGASVLLDHIECNRYYETTYPEVVYPSCYQYAEAIEHCAQLYNIDGLEDPKWVAAEDLDLGQFILKNKLWLAWELDTTLKNAIYDEAWQLILDVGNALCQDPTLDIYEAAALSAQEHPLTTEDPRSGTYMARGYYFIELTPEDQWYYYMEQDGEENNFYHIEVDITYEDSMVPVTKKGIAEDAADLLLLDLTSSTRSLDNKELYLVVTAEDIARGDSPYHYPFILTQTSDEEHAVKYAVMDIGASHYLYIEYAETAYQDGISRFTMEEFALTYLTQIKPDADNPEQTQDTLDDSQASN